MRVQTPRCSRPGCRRPVERARCGKHYRPRRGWREIDGVAWKWFCSRACSGMESGRRNAESGLLARQLFPAAQGRYRLMNDRRRAQFATEAADLHRYGVPVDLAIALLDRVFQVGARHGRDVMRRKAQMRQATTAARGAPIGRNIGDEED